MALQLSQKLKSCNCLPLVIDTFAYDGIAVYAEHSVHSFSKCMRSETTTFGVKYYTRHVTTCIRFWHTSSLFTADDNAVYVLLTVNGYHSWTIMAKKTEIERPDQGVWVLCTRLYLKDIRHFTDSYLEMHTNSFTRKYVTV
uniref:Uncharacterized protein n=1 Tax=Glossina austeni TaxID=7395 RepID=A0A1A9UHK7_GLOAU